MGEFLMVPESLSDAVEWLDSRLLEWRMAQVADSGSARALETSICDRVLTGNRYLELWDERVLLGLCALFSDFAPHSQFRAQIDMLNTRAHTISKVNDLFFAFIDPLVNSEALAGLLSATLGLSKSDSRRISEDPLIHDARSRAVPPSQRLTALVDYLQSELGSAATDVTRSLKSCLDAVRLRERPGVVNALLVQEGSSLALVVPINVATQTGDGETRVLTRGEVGFEKAVERAREALVADQMIHPSTQVALMGDFPQARYSGDSIALPAAMGIYSSARAYAIDQFTAFTGDIALRGCDWEIGRIQSLQAKLAAARDFGIRRVFLPSANMPDIPQGTPEHVSILTVTRLSDIYQHLIATPKRIGADRPLERKVAVLKKRCLERGWHLSEPRPVQRGTQYTVSRATGPALKVVIYDSGAHTPHSADDADLKKLLDALNELDAQASSIKSVQLVLTVDDLHLRDEIKTAMMDVPPLEETASDGTEYVMRFVRGEESLVVTQYRSGKLQIQGKADSLLRAVAETVVSRFNLRYPTGHLRVEDLIREATEGGARPARITATRAESTDFPYIGIDESGKGDYFGPLVIAAVWLDEETHYRLRSLGVKDSKELSDRQCRELAQRVRELCQGKCEEVEISPERYNSLYTELQRERQNLNNLLAWGHARALESLLGRFGSRTAIADQFGDERYVRSKLMAKGKSIELVQKPKAEQYMAVAAASVLARDRFLFRLEQLSGHLGVTLPKGASNRVVEVARQLVERAGPLVLNQVAKLHFKTTTQVIGGDHPGW